MSSSFAASSKTLHVKPCSCGVYVSLEQLLALRVAASKAGHAKHYQTQGILPGDSKSRVRGQGVEFEETRPYQTGDDIRAMDWRVTARTGKPFTKLFTEERERAVFLVLDQRMNMFFGSAENFKSEIAARLAAMIGWRTLMSGDRIGGLVAGSRIEAFRCSTTRRTFLQLLQAVVDANNALHALGQSNISLDQILQDCRQQTTRGTTLAIVSDFHDLNDQGMRSLMALSQKRNLIIIRVTDPLESGLPALRGAGIGNGVDTVRISLSRADRLQFSEQAIRKEKELLERLSKYALKTISVSTRSDLTAVLSHFFRLN